MESEESPDVSAHPETERLPVTGPPGEAALQPVIEPEATASVPEDVEEVSPEPEIRGERPTRVRTRTNWLLTIIVGLGMLLLGGMGGYIAHSVQTAPSLAQLAALSSAATVTAATATAAASQPSAQQPQPTPDMQGLLTMLVSKTRHFKGDANAPVTILEFSDFQ